MMEFWAAVKRVTEHRPQSEWTWAEWLSVIDLARVPCYHPIRFRLAVGDWEIPGAMIVSEQRVIDIPWLFDALRTKRSTGYISFCEVCRTFCPSPPVDVRAKREKMLADILNCVTADDNEWE